VTRPEIVLCDEPFSGLDPVTVRRIEGLLIDLNRRHGLTLVVASHHIASARRMAQQVVLVIDGEPFAGSAAELEASPDARVREFFTADEDGPEAPASATVREARA
jgi:phospholipid/cholesterol/gamma-HCH transport system ATP-binding protein